MDPEIIGALIGPILTAVLAGVAVGFKEWRRRRESADQRHETLRQAADEVAFIDAWLTAYAKIAPEAEQRKRAPRALADVEPSYATMTASHQAAAAAPGPGPRSTCWRGSCCLGCTGRPPRCCGSSTTSSQSWASSSSWPGCPPAFAGRGKPCVCGPGRHGVHPDVVRSGDPVLRACPAGRPAATDPGQVAAEPLPGPYGYPAWPDYSYPGPLPSPPGQVGAGYPQSG